MLYIVRALVYLLQTALDASGVDLTVTTSQSAPPGAPLLGTTSVMQNGYVVQTFTRGTGPAKTTFWTGYWSAAGS
jgi:hypothetical protein